MKFEKYYQELLELNVGTILKDEPLYKHTTYRVGGPARLFIKVKDVEGLISVSYTHLDVYKRQAFN